ncbi:hypothetical protein [Aeromonas jandaei]|uniref:hypothetical protein n=1 Tax=Aeromonas jandaei TaxID=650 RepID=UPI001ABF9444|nr:hypothetical protein [Aeromonas jandaei]QSR71230.1 hypothetical protein GP488_01690 [Aeromonas jandaei]
MFRNIIFAIVFFILIAPVATYAFKFGIGFWEKPEEWSDLGGYIGGVYTPILTLLTLSVLCVQIYLQMAQHRQHLVSIQETQLTEYLGELNNELDKEVGEGLTLRSYLIGTYNTLNSSELNSIDLTVVNQLNQAHHKLYSMWSGAMACLLYIKTCSNIKNLESTHYLIQKNKIIAYMGPQVCSSLDKHNYAMQLLLNSLTKTETIQNIKYEFWIDKSQP